MSLDDFETWLAYESLTGNITGTRADYRTSILTSIVAHYLGDEDATPDKYAPKFLHEDDIEAQEKVAEINQKAWFQSLVAK